MKTTTVGHIKFPLSKYTVVLGVYFYNFLLRKSMVLTKIIPNIDHKQPGGGTSYCGEKSTALMVSSFLCKCKAGWECIIQQ